jgi:hypothetical protein
LRQGGHYQQGKYCGQRHAGKTKSGELSALRITFKEPLEAAWFERLPGVNAVNKLDAYNWEIFAADYDRCPQAGNAHGYRQ